MNDLERALSLGNRTDVLTLSGLDSAEGSEARFAETNPARLLPLGVPQALMISDQDAPWRLEMTGLYAKDAQAGGDTARVFIVPGANHMDVVDARSGFAARVADEARRLLK